MNAARVVGRSGVPEILAAVLLVAITAVSASAQAGRATITGRVLDATGALIPAAEVVATHMATGAITETRSNDRGAYALVNLPIGTYTIEFKRPGFSALVLRDIVVGVQSAPVVDATLTVGEVTDAVTVAGDRGLTDSAGGAIGTTLQQATVNRLPLAITGGRSIENFAYAIAPGVEGNNWMSNIVGGAPFSKEVILDGTSATIQIQGHITESSPPMEAVDEYKVQTSGMGAEYGRTGGGILNFSLRSGTNAFHGSGYGQMRHEALNANTWMNKYLSEIDPSDAQSYVTPRDRQHLAGVSLGGPLRANRTFFFAAFEEYRQTRRQLGAYDRTVPTDAFLN